MITEIPIARDFRHSCYCDWSDAHTASLEYKNSLVKLRNNAVLVWVLSMTQVHVPNIMV